MNSNSSFDGFYCAYLAGEMGNSLALFVFSEGRVVGCDVGGGTYGGHYKLADQPNQIDALIEFNLPVGGATITGAASDDDLMRLEVPLILPVQVDPTAVHRLETPVGPLNARFRKLRGM